LQGQDQSQESILNPHDLTRGVIEFDAETIIAYFADPERVMIILVVGPIVFLTLLAILAAIFIKRRRHREAQELESSMTIEKSDEERDAVPPPPDGVTYLRQPDQVRDEIAEDLDDIQQIKAVDEKGWLTKLKSGLNKTRQALTGNLVSIFSGKAALDDALLERIHEVLYRSDIGVKTADRLIDALKRDLRKNDAVTWEDARAVLEKEVTLILSSPEVPAVDKTTVALQVILIVGVNGVGKTTSIGKLAAHFIAEEKQVLLCAADTFRAAAIDQLKVWGQRLGVETIAHQQGADPAAVAYDAVKAAIARKADVLIVDTAGRLHSKKELMDELAKINRVIGKDLPGAPHETWLVIDATTGQNAAMQTKAFRDVVKLSGLVVTKLDGTAKGGAIIGIVNQHQLPIRYLGVGEKANDLRAFKAEDFAKSLFDG